LTVAAQAKLDEDVAHLRQSDPVLRGLIDTIGPDNLGDRRRGRPRVSGTLLRAPVSTQ